MKWLVVLSVVLTCVTAARDSRAWVSLTTQGDRAVIDVQPDGSAVVEHDVLLRVRGGPLKELTFTGVDEDATLVGDPTIVRARSQERAGVPIPLLGHREGSNLKLALAYKKGLGSGSYLVHFAYQTDLAASGLIERGGDAVEISWQGLTFSDGIDSITTEFVLPRGQQPPSLPSVQNQHGLNVAASEAGVFLSELRRDGERDRLLLTRPHVARQERVTWTIRVSPEVLDGNNVTDTAHLPVVPEVGVVPAGRRPAAWSWALGACVGALLACSMLMKRWALRCGGGVARFLLPMPLMLRWILVYAGAAASVLAVTEAQSATWAASAFVLATILAMQVPKLPKTAARGPGAWRPLKLNATLWSKDHRRPFLARLLDGSTVAGFCLFAASAGALAVTALRQLGEDPFVAAALAAACVGLVPIFYTLGSVRPGETELVLQKRCLRPVVVKLEKLRLSPRLMGRIARATEQVDEYRLSLTPSPRPNGLLSVEVAVEIDATALAVNSLPVLIVKFVEHSAAASSLRTAVRSAPRLLSRGAEWSRGPDTDSRVAVLRPALPSVELFAEICERVLAALAEPPAVSDPGDRRVGRNSAGRSGAVRVRSKRRSVASRQVSATAG